MSLPYPYHFDNEINVYTASYFNKVESDLFIDGLLPEYWYGISDSDIIELSVFNLNDEIQGWNPIYTEKKYKSISSTYVNEKEQIIVYNYNELLSDFNLYKNNKILVNPIDDISSSFGIISGDYSIVYNFLRNMAGNHDDPLVISDISPSRTEIKLLPSKKSNETYAAFCIKKFQIKNVAPLILRILKDCPYSQIYNKIKEKYQSDITFLKNLMNLNSDGEFLNFLKKLYEDFSIYPDDRLKRIQGIQTYYFNYLLSNYESTTDFEGLSKRFKEIIQYRLNFVFLPYGNQSSKEYVNAKNFLYDFFFEEYYTKVINPISKSFSEKYFSELKNGLNFGGGIILPILTHTFLDERASNDSPYTLLIKLKNELPNNINIQNTCWISNISIPPYISYINLKSQDKIKTIKLNFPNFSLTQENISEFNINKNYTYNDLKVNSDSELNISINKKLNELSVDYSNFNEFIVFSSAQSRTNIFKKKIVDWTILSASLSELNQTYEQSILNENPYPYYSIEKTKIEDRMEEILKSFDGYESFLFKSEEYEYDILNKSFVNPQAVISRDEEAIKYDKFNRDSFVNCSPEHIVLDENNNDYLIFLMMVGHYFDNIYLYIKCLPSEKNINNTSSETLSKKVIDLMLESFGWKLDSTYENYTLESVFDSSETSELSEEDRIKSIRSRILITLPNLYKEKGSVDAIKLLLACYGIPQSLLSIREYGGTDYSIDSDIVYTKNEKSCMFGISGSYKEIDAYFLLNPKVRSSVFRILLKNSKLYPIQSKREIHRQVYSYNPISTNTNISTVGWSVGFWRERGNLGKFYFEIGSGSYGKSESILTSSNLPIFNGDIWTVLVRRNEPNTLYSYNSDENLFPIKYDLVIQRNELGRVVFKDTISKNLDYIDNKTFDGISDNINLLSQPFGSIKWGAFSNGIYNFDIGNMTVWNVPISDSDFEAHCNDFNSYAYSGSAPEDKLILRIDYDEPKNIITDILDEGGGVYWASGILENKSDYYSTFVNRYANIIKSGSWIGATTGSLSAIGGQLNFIGNLKGSTSGSLSGSAIGTFSDNTSVLSRWSGWGNGHLSGSFNGVVIGHITGSDGMFYADDPFLGNWSGQLTGSMTASFTGSTSEISYFSGSSKNRHVLFTGSFTGVLSGSGENYATGYLTGAFIGDWTGSAVDLYTLPILPYSIYYNDFYYYPLNPKYTFDYSTCTTITESGYPYQFNVYNLDKTLMTKEYGPNRLKNEKIKYKKQNLDVRLDDSNRSTYTVGYELAQDSNLLGLFVDPQDFKNRDITRFLGNYDIVGLISSPSDLYSASYSQLKSLNDLYNSFGNKKVLINELITLYKIYFNRSIFESCKNLLPARTNIRTGILIEPTVIERSKYQYKKIIPEINNGDVQYLETFCTKYFRDPNTKILKFYDNKFNLLFGEFSTGSFLITTLDESTLPSNYIGITKLKSSGFPNFIYPTNINNNYIPNSLDDLQFSYFSTIGKNEWFKYPGTFGETNKFDFIKSEEDSSDGYFILKMWNKYTFYSKSGSYIKTSNKSEDFYTTSSTFLYKLIAMPSNGYKYYFYTEENLEDALDPTSSPTRLSDVIFSGGYKYRHLINTAKRTPNLKITDVKGTEVLHFGIRIALDPFFKIGEDTYFEVFKGYPSNHYTHKSMQFSPKKYKMILGNKKSINEFIYIKSQQTVNSTIGKDGLEDGSLPVQTFEVSNINLQQGDNVINR